MQEIFNKLEKEYKSLNELFFTHKNHKVVEDLYSDCTIQFAVACDMIDSFEGNRELYYKKEKYINSFKNLISDFKNIKILLTQLENINFLKNK